MSRSKIAVSLRVDPDIKVLGERRAKADRRSFASYIEWLVDTDVKNRPLTPTATTQKAIEEARFMAKGDV